MEGLGQLHGVESSPDFSAGWEDFIALDPANTLEQSASSGQAQTGMVHMGGTGSSGTPSNRTNHWSNLLDVKNGPLFWLMLATLGYLGLISLHVSAGLGRRR